MMGQDQEDNGFKSLLTDVADLDADAESGWGYVDQLEMSFDTFVNRFKDNANDDNFGYE